MNTNEIRQDQSYVWYGMMGFSRPEDDLPFSGQITYSHAEGIKVNILSRDRKFQDTGDPLSFRMMHAAVSDGHKLYQLTLYNVLLNNWKTNFDATEFVGEAELLIDCWIHSSTAVLEVRAEYEPAYEDFLFWRSKRDRGIVELSKLSPFLLASGWEISFTDRSAGISLRDLRDIDTVFMSDEETISKLKGASADVLKERSGEIFLRRTTQLYTCFKHPEMRLEGYLEKLNQWEKFIEFLIDDDISPLSTVITFEDTSVWGEGKRKQARAIFGLRKGNAKRRRSPAHHHQLPINFSTFQTNEDQYSLNTICEAFERWVKVFEAVDWRPIKRLIHRSRNFTESFGDTPQFASNFSDMSTFLSLTDRSQRGLPDEMIKKYASSNWKKAVRKFFPYAKTDSDLDKFLGEQLKEIRNSIEHPSDDERRGRSFHRAIREDAFKMHAINAYVTGLLLKALLHYLGVSDAAVTEKFLNNFIESHGLVRPVSFTDD